MSRLIAVVCLALCLTGSAIAAPTPNDPSTEGDVTCVVFPPLEIIPGQTFDLRVSRVPGYPGGWFVPTVQFKVVYPTAAGWEYIQRDQRTIGKMGVIRVDGTLFAPYSLYSDPDGGFVAGERVKIVATVLDGAGVRTTCTATTTIAF